LVSCFCSTRPLAAAAGAGSRSVGAPAGWPRPQAADRGSLRLARVPAIALDQDSGRPVRRHERAVRAHRLAEGDSWQVMPTEDGFHPSSAPSSIIRFASCPPPPPVETTAIPVPAAPPRATAPVA
jgi:hypothetical protein